jgi:hypothetical protein
MNLPTCGSPESGAKVGTAEEAQLFCDEYCHTSRQLPHACLVSWLYSCTSSSALATIIPFPLPLKYLNRNGICVRYPTYAIAYRKLTHYCAHVSDEVSIEGISEQTFYVFILTLTSVYAVIQASDIPHPIASRHYAFVEIIAGNDSRRTESIKLKKNAPTRWDAHFVL